MNGPSRTVHVERLHHCFRDLSSGANPPSPEQPAGVEPRPLDAPAGPIFDDHCAVCGAPRDKHHLSFCDLRGDA